MPIAQIAELLNSFLDPANERSKPALSEAKGLTTDDLRNISIYIDMLLRWNARINLTAIGNPEQIVTRHFGESFFAARHLFPNRSRAAANLEASPEHASASRRSLACHDPGQEADHQPPTIDGQSPLSGDRLQVADLGSGAGFPGIPLKLWAPEIALTLIESNHKKTAFLREVARALTLTDINILHARATSTGIDILGDAAAAHAPAQFDLVTLRAVERFATILPIAANLVRPGGRLALLISSAQFDLAHQSHLSLRWSDPLLIPQSRSRVLLVAHRSAS